MIRALAALAALILAVPPAYAAAGTKCAALGPALWGDGVHDDTAALNAWFRGDSVVWAQTGRAVGSQIGGGANDEKGDRLFRLTGPVYIPSGTGRRIEKFEFVWPWRRERISGGTIVTGQDPDKPPVATGLRKVGARPGEGVPFESPDVKPDNRDQQASCLVS